MSNTTVESIFWLFAIVLFGALVFSPPVFFRFLGRDRGMARGVTTFFRVAGSVCLLGTIYRLVSLWQR